MKPESTQHSVSSHVDEADRKGLSKRRAREGRLITDRNYVTYCVAGRTEIRSHEIKTIYFISFHYSMALVQIASWLV
jgi:hypothetical protein